jgi:hypothetical protein
MDRINVDGSAAREIRVQFDALLVAPLLEPVAGEMGAAGGIGIDLFAREIAARLEPLT